jgi:hypothetical protein
MHKARRAAKPRFVCYIDKKTGTVSHGYRGVPGKDPKPVEIPNRLRRLAMEQLDECSGSSRTCQAKLDDESAFHWEDPSAAQSVGGNGSGTSYGQTPVLDMDPNVTPELYIPIEGLGGNTTEQEWDFLNVALECDLYGYEDSFLSLHGSVFGTV